MSLRIYLTDKDQEVLRFVEQYGSITIKQTQKMFYNTQNYGYDIARRRLKKMVSYGKLNMVRDLNGNENVYYMDKRLTYHDLLVLDYYAELIYHGAEIVYFKPRQSWMDRKIISDAYCCYARGNKASFNIVEVVRTHGVEVEKYKKLYESGEPQKFNSLIFQKLGGTQINEFPKIVTIDNVTHNNELYINDKIKTVKLDFSLRNFSKIF